MKAQKILVIEDHQDIQALIEVNLKTAGFEVLKAFTAEDGVEMAKKQSPSLILLDRMLPGIQGVEACQMLKRNPLTSQIPVMMVTAKSADEETVLGLDSGADDYLPKPFSPKVLVARVKALLRRRSEKYPYKEEELKIGDFTIHLGKHEVRKNGVILDLTRSEFDILYLLSSRPGWAFSRTEIVDHVKGDNYAVTERSVDVQIVGLRKKLDQLSNQIETVRGVGYRFKEL